MMDVAFQRTTVDGDVQRTTARFRTQPEMLLNASDVTTESMTAQFLSAIENFNKRGSNWLIERILDFCIMLGPYRPALASPCVSSRPDAKKVTVPDVQVAQSRTELFSSFVPTPPEIATTKAIVNVYNHGDTLCFLWSILAAKHPATHHPSRIQHYRPHLHELVTSDLTFPLPVCDIPKFENANADISVNVCGYEDGKLIPLYVTPHRHRNLHVNLLLLKNHHYVLIRHLSRLVTQRNKHNGLSFVCSFCIHCFTCKNALLKHMSNCHV